DPEPQGFKLASQRTRNGIFVFAGVTNEYVPEHRCKSCLLTGPSPDYYHISDPRRPSHQMCASLVFAPQRPVTTRRREVRFWEVSPRRHISRAAQQLSPERRNRCG